MVKLYVSNNLKNLNIYDSYHIITRYTWFIMSIFEILRKRFKLILLTKIEKQNCLEHLRFKVEQRIYYCLYNGMFIYYFYFFVCVNTILGRRCALIFKIKRDFCSKLNVNCRYSFLVIFQNFLSLKSYKRKTDRNSE